MKNVQNRNGFYSVFSVLLYFCFGFALLFAIYGFAKTPKLSLFNPNASEYEGEWRYETDDGETISFHLPYSLDVADGKAVTISTTLPDEIADETYICFVTSRRFKAYIDDVEIYSYDAETKILPGRAVKAIHIPIKLLSSYAGKEFKYVRTETDGNNGNFNTCYIGNLLGILYIPISQQFIQFIFACVLIFISLITILIFSIIGKRRGKFLPLIMLAEGILAISLWVIFDSTIFQFIFARAEIDGLIGYMLAILLAAPFLGYINRIQNGRYIKLFTTLYCLIICNFVVLTILQFTNIFSYVRALNYIDICIVIYIIVMVGTETYDYLVRKDEEHKHVFFGLLSVGIFGFIEVAFIIIKSYTQKALNTDGIFIVIGMLALLICAILDQVKALNKMQENSQAAMMATKAKSDFLANMSHEIRTPINAIMGMNEMILRESSEESVLEYARDVAGASESLLGIVNDILDFSKIESGMLAIENDEYNLGELINDVTTLVNMRAEKKGLKFKTIVNPQLPNILFGDDKRVREIMVNILNNAVKYTQIGEIRFIVDGKKEDRNLILNVSVSDTGQGIKKEDLDKIFTGFERVDSKKNRHIEGTGLGLSITKSLVELMNGTIVVESEYGIGSTFMVTIPQQIIKDEPIGDYTDHKHASKFDKDMSHSLFEAPNASILIVDDAALNLKVISKLLQRTKMDVICANSGQQALELIRKMHFDIIMLDHMMPNMDGIETLEQARKMDGNKCKDTPVIALTANAIVGAREAYLEAGFNNYLSKPVEPRALEEMIINYLPKEKVIYLD